MDRRVAGDQAFMQRGKGDGELDGRAGLGTGREGQILIDHGEDAAVGWIDDNGGAVHAVERVDGCLANDGVFTRGDVGGEDVAFCKRTSGEALVKTMGTVRETCVTKFWCRGVNPARRGGAHGRVKMAAGAAHVVLYVESSGRVDAETQCSCCQTQGKNARQSHSQQIPSTMECVRYLPRGSANFKNVQPTYATRAGRRL